MEQQTLTRQQLYDLVWTTPLGILARRYNMSHQEFKKLCTDFEIPTPRPGHWMKLKFSKPAEIIMLPENLPTDKEITISLKEDVGQLGKGTFSRLDILEKEIIAQEGDNLIVPERLSSPCDLILNIKNAFERKERYYNKGGLLRASYSGLNINVAPANYGRALRFMDTFIKIIKGWGYDVYNRNRLTYFEMHKEQVQIRITEKLNRVLKPSKPDWPEYDYSASGTLMFSIVADWNTITWKDSKIPLEKQLPKIISRLKIIGERLKNKRIELEASWAIQHEKRRIIEEKQIRTNKELTDFKKLLKSVSRWHIAEDLRNYLNKVEENAKGNNTYSDDLKKWIDWARKKADWYDPLISSADEYLIESDLDKFSS